MVSYQFPNIPKEEVEQKYEACGYDINLTISAILDIVNDGEYPYLYVDTPLPAFFFALSMRSEFRITISKYFKLNSRYIVPNSSW